MKMENPQKTKGVYLLAMGKPLYGRLAYNLAESIKANNPDLPITLGHSGNALQSLSRTHLRVFNQTVKLDEDTTHYKDKFSPFRAKLAIHKTLPYDANIFIDADSLIFPTRSLYPIFDELNGNYLHPATIMHIPINEIKNNGRRVFAWGDLYQAKLAFDLKHDVYIMSTTFMYIEKKPQTNIFFDKAIEIHDLIANKDVNISNMGYNGQLADEPIFAFTGSLLGFKPQYMGYIPIAFGNDANFPRSLDECTKRFYGLTIPGTANMAYAENLYNSIVKKNGLRNGVGLPFYWENKNLKLEKY